MSAPVKSEQEAKRLGNMVVAAAFLAVFCLFGFRSTFSVLQGPMREAQGWTTAQTSLGYSLMMVVYAVTAFFSGALVDRGGTRPAYFMGAVFAGLGFYLTSLVNSVVAYLAVYAIFAGVGTGMLWVSSTISVRKWYVGKSYATMWGIAFAGAPLAQVVLSQIVKRALVTTTWQVAMRILAVVVFVALIIAGLLARKNPEDEGVTPFGLEGNKKGAAPDHIWTVGEAFRTFPIWGTIIAFLTSMVAEFLIWTQVVSYWTQDLNMSLASATNLYVAIGIAGIFTMPIMGKVADALVGKMPHESQARKTMLIFAPVVGVVACILLLVAGKNTAGAIVACILFAVYWAIEPGGCAGYAGAIYGGKSLGKIWGLATLIVMGIGPAVGSFMGAYLYDLNGTYTNSILFALGAFVISAIAAIMLPNSLARVERSESVDKVS